MVSRRTSFRKNTLRRRKLKRRGHSRRQRGGGVINVYLQLNGTTITNPSSDVPLADASPFSTGVSMITVNFKTPIRFAGATWSRSVNGKWEEVGIYLTTVANSSYTFQATQVSPTGTSIKKRIIKRPTRQMPLGSTNIYEEPVNGISTSSITINNITENTSQFLKNGIRASSMPSPTDDKPVNIKITLRTLP